MCSVGNESLLNQCNLLCQLKDIYKRRYLRVVFFLLRFYSTLTDSLCCQHGLICHGEKVTAVSAELFQKHLESRKVGSRLNGWSDSLYSLFSLKFNTGN